MGFFWLTVHSSPLDGLMVYYNGIFLSLFIDSNSSSGCKYHSVKDTCCNEIGLYDLNMDNVLS